MWTAPKSKAEHDSLQFKTPYCRESLARGEYDAVPCWALGTRGPPLSSDSGGRLMLVSWTSPSCRHCHRSNVAVRPKKAGTRKTYPPALLGFTVSNSWIPSTTVLNHPISTANWGPSQLRSVLHTRLLPLTAGANRRVFSASVLSRLLKKGVQVGNRRSRSLKPWFYWRKSCRSHGTFSPFGFADRPSWGTGHR